MVTVPVPNTFVIPVSVATLHVTEAEGSVAVTLDPTANSVIIWTRVTTTDPSASVTWRVATDTGMTNVLGTGTVTTDANRDFTVKVKLAGLLSDQFYYYEFEHNGKRSLRGRTKTAPSAATANVRFAVVSCSNYPSGYFNAYKAIKDRNDVDAVIHLGDYIYEYGNGEYWFPLTIFSRQQRYWFCQITAPGIIITGWILT